MTISKLTAAVLAASMLVGGAATASTITESIWLTGHRGLQNTGDALTYTSNSGVGLSATGHFLNGDGTIGDAVQIGEYSNGLGITTPDYDYTYTCYYWYTCSGTIEDQHVIDGKTYDEVVKLTFDHVVTIEKVWFTYVDSNDDFAFSFTDGNDNTSFYASTDINGLGTGSYTFSQDWTGTMFGIGATGKKDNFKLKKVKYSYHKPEVIPLPAAGWLLLAGLGGLAAVKRRKS